jgi:hypothetical protein
MPTTAPTTRTRNPSNTSRPRPTRPQCRHSRGVGLNAVDPFISRRFSSRKSVTAVSLRVACFPVHRQPTRQRSASARSGKVTSPTGYKHAGHRRRWWPSPARCPAGHEPAGRQAHGEAAIPPATDRSPRDDHLTIAGRRRRHSGPLVSAARRGIMAASHEETRGAVGRRWEQTGRESRPRPVRCGEAGGRWRPPPRFPSP